MICLQIIDLPLSILSLSTPSHKSHIIYALTWTTTPWTLPLNNAISIDSNQEYSLIQMDDQSKYPLYTLLQDTIICRNPIVELYIVATQLIDSLRSQFSPRSFTVRGTLKGSYLNGK